MLYLFFSLCLSTMLHAKDATRENGSTSDVVPCSNGKLKAVAAQTERVSDDDVYAVAFSPDGTRVLSGYVNGDVKLSDVASAKELRTFSHGEKVNAVTFSPDGTRVLSGGNQTLNLWEVASGKKLKQWDLNQPALNVSFSTNGQLIHVGTSAYWIDFPVGDAAPFVQQAEKVERSAAATTKIITLNIRPNDYSAQNPYRVNRNSLLIKGTIATNLPFSSISTSLHFLINGNEEVKGKTIGNVSLNEGKEQEHDFDKNINLIEGLNRIEITLTMPDNSVVKSLPLYVSYSPAEKPNLYLFSFGVASTDLKFTTADATVVTGLFSKQTSLYNKVYTDKLLVGEQTSTQKIRQEMENFSKIKDNIREQDLIIVFGSSHGTTRIENEFRIIGKDWSDDSPKSTSISYKAEILAYLSPLKGKKLILIDACHSGEIVGKDKMDASTILAQTPEGIATITSSTGSELSYEHESWQNSSFVKSIKEALQEGKADVNKDNYVTVQELYDYLYKRVPVLVKSVKDFEKCTQTPQLKKEGVEDFPIYQVKP